MRLSVLLLVCLLAGTAVAQPIDDSPNGIGIYFDQGATVFCADATPGTMLTAYLCLTNPSESSDLIAWEARIESSVPSALVGFEIMGDGESPATAPEFVVSFGTPLPAVVSTVLLKITIDVVWEWSIAMRVWPASSPSGADNLPAYATTLEPSNFISLQYLWGWDPQTEVPEWSAAVNNPDCLDGPTVPAKDTSWGAVKALYR